MSTLSPASTITKLRLAFLSALLAGVLGIAFGSLVDSTATPIVVPIAAMAAYASVGHRLDPTNASTQQFADSLYYLGFLFTLVALVISLYAFVGESGDSIDVDGVVGRFAVALSTTVLGLSARVFLLSFQEEMEDSVRRSEMALAQAAHALRAQLDQISQTMIGQGELMEASFGSALTRTTKSLKKTADTFEAQLQKVTSKLEPASQSFLESTQRASENLGKALTDSSTSLTLQVANAQKTLEKAVDSLAESIRSQHLPQNALVGAVEEATTHLRSEIENLGSRIASLSSGDSPNLASLRLEVGSLADALEKAAVELKDVTGISGTLSQISKSLEPLAEHMRVASESVGRQADTLDRAVDKAKAHNLTLESEIESVRKRAARLEGAVDDAEADLLKVSSALTAAARYVRKELSDDGQD